MKIHIIESNPNFTEFTVVQTVNSVGEVRPIYIGHLNEYHYVSSLPLNESAGKRGKRLYQKKIYEAFIEALSKRDYSQFSEHDFLAELAEIN